MSEPSHFSKYPTNFIPSIDFGSFGDVSDPDVWSKVHDGGTQLLENIANVRVPMIPIALEELDLPYALHELVAGSMLSIADIAHFGWLWRRELAGIEVDEAPHVARWFAALEARPAFRRGVARTTALADPALAAA